MKLYLKVNVMFYEALDYLYLYLIQIKIVDDYVRIFGTIQQFSYSD